VTATSRVRHWLFLGVLAVHLAPVLYFTYLPASDGPGHVYNAHVVEQRLLGDDPSVPYFRFNPAPAPNWLGHVLLSLAMLIMPAAASERTLQLLYVLTFPLAFRYFLRSAAQDTKGLEFLAFPFVYGIHFHWGFYNFCLSLVLYLFTLGTWMRWRGRLSALRMMTLSCLLVLTYFSSLVGFIQCLFAMAALLLIDAALTKTRPRLSELAWTGLAAFPAVSMSVWFAMRQVNRGPLPAEFPPRLWAAANLFRFDILRTFTDAEKPLAIGFALLFWLGIAFQCHQRWKTGRIQGGLGFLLLGAATIPIVFLAPTTAGGGTMLTPREVYFVVFALALWLASGPLPAFFRHALAGASIVVSLGLLILHWPIYSQYDAGMCRLLSGLEHAPLSGRKTVFASTLGNPFPQNVDPRTRRVDLSGGLGGYFAIEHGLVYLNDYEPQTTHFPLIYRYSLAGAGRLRYATAPNRTVDVVLLWGVDDQAAKNTLAAQILRSPFDCFDYPGLPEHPTLFLPRESKD